MPSIRSQALLISKCDFSILVVSGACCLPYAHRGIYFYGVLRFARFFLNVLPLAVFDGDGFERRESVQGFKSFLTTIPG